MIFYYTFANVEKFSYNKVIRDKMRYYIHNYYLYFPYK
jgi:hypothetical protein